MNKILTLLALGVLSSNAIAASKGDTYTGFQYALGTYSEDGFPDTNPNAIVGRFGKYLKDDFSIEGRLGVGVGDDSATVSGIDVSIEIDTVFGVYGLKHVDIGNASSIYGALGFTRGELTASAPGISVSDDDSGLSFGVGVNFNNINIEFMQYLNKSDFDVSAISFGITF
jgi:outer membrane immunogenic protein